MRIGKERGERETLFIESRTVLYFCFACFSISCFGSSWADKPKADNIRWRKVGGISAAAG